MPTKVHSSYSPRGAPAQKLNFKNCAAGRAILFSSLLGKFGQRCATSTMASAEGAVPRHHPTLDREQQNLVTKLQEWLQPTKFRSPGSEYAKHVRAYSPGTGAWARKSPEFRSWRDGSASDSDQQKTQETGCLWVKGVPGSGKSVFSASIVHLLEDTKPDTPVLFFFFRQIVQRNHDPKYLIRDFAS